MSPTLLRRILIWVAPVVIGYVVKKFEERQQKKKLQKNPTKSNL